MNIVKEKAKKKFAAYRITIDVESLEENEGLQNILHLASNCIWHSEGRKTPFGVVTDTWHQYKKERDILKKLFDAFEFNRPSGVRL